MSSKPASQLQQRNYILKLEERFGFKNLCVLKSLKIKRARGIQHIQLNINDVKFDPTSTSIHEFTFDCKTIREQCRDALGLSEEEAALVSIEQYFVHNQLKAIQYYQSLNKDELNNSIFTTELAIHCIVRATTKIDKLEVTEESYKSDQQLVQK